MIESEKPAFLKILIGLAAVKPGKGLTEEAYEIWWGAMARWSLDDFRAAANHLAGSVEFMPSPFHFEQLRRAGRPTSGEAFAIALKACGSAIQCGQVTNNGTSGDPLIDAAVRALGGYGVLAMCDQDKTHFLERRFAEHYEAMSDSEDVRAALPGVAGPPRIVSDLTKRLTRQEEPTTEEP
jgi:hypothetical protein